MLGALLDELRKALAALLVGRVGIESARADHDIAGPDIGLKSAGFDQNHADAERMSLDPQGLAPAFESEFRTTVSAEHGLAEVSGDGSDLDDVSGLLVSHDGNHGLAHGDGPEEVGLELVADVGEREVFAESGDTESRVVDQHIDTAVVAHDGFDHAGKGIEFGYIHAANVEFLAHTGFGGGRLQLGGAAGVSHGGHHEVAMLGELNGCQQTDPAGTSRNYCDFLVTHGSPPNPSNRQPTAKWFHSHFPVCHRTLNTRR